MNMERTIPGWTPCAYPLCDPGGIGTPIDVVVKGTGPSVWPANSLEISVTGPAGTNLLVYKKIGATNATYFTTDFWAFLGDSAYAGAYEYDIFAFNAPYRFMWGSQCLVAKEWDIWDDLHQKWIPTVLPCTLTQDKWHHIQWWVHRVDGDANCGGGPCMYYDMLGVDDVYTTFANGKQPAGRIPAGWANGSGIQFQLDVNDSAINQVNLTEFFQLINLTQIGN
jgi:hypothetical protein